MKPYLFIEKLNGLPFIESIWLYGSRARGDFQERSDIDLAIVCPKATDEDWQRVLSIIEDADTLLKIDCVRFDTVGGLLREEILRHKKVLYERKGVYVSKEYFLALGKALQRLQEALQHPDIETNDLVVDATIQRFEFCIELFWKMLRKLLFIEKIEASTPRESIQKAFQNKLLGDETVWLSMMDDRNKTSSTYEQEEFSRIFERIKTYAPIMLKSYENLRKKYFPTIPKQFEESASHAQT